MANIKNNFVKPSTVEFFLATIVICLVLAFVLSDFLLTPGRTTYSPALDLISFTHPNKVFKIHWLSKGIIPLWTPNEYCGHPFHAGSQGAVFYPPDLLLFILPPVIFYKVSMFLHYLMAGIGVFFFCRREIRTQWVSAVFAAVSYSASTYFTSRMQLGIFPPIMAGAYLPWIYYFVFRYFRKHQTKDACLAGVGLSMQILCGFPQIALMTLATVPILLFFLAIPKREYFQFFKGIFCIFGVGLGLSAVQLLPSYEFVSLSYRGSSDWLQDETFRGSVKFFEILKLFLFPDTASYAHPWETSFFIGKISFVFAVMYLVFAFFSKLLTRSSVNQRKRELFLKYVLPLGVIAILGILISLGNTTSISKWIILHVSSLSSSRVPARWMLLCMLSVSIFGAMGMGFVLRRLSQRPRIVLGILLLSLVSVELKTAAGLFMSADKPIYSLDEIWSNSLAKAFIGADSRYFAEYKAHNGGLLFQTDSFGGLDGLVLKDMINAHQVFGPPPLNDLLLDLSNVSVVKSNDGEIKYRDSFLPRAWLTRSYAVAQKDKDVSQILKDYWKDETHFVILDNEPEDLSLVDIKNTHEAPEFKGSVHIHPRSNPNSLTIDVDASESALLFFSEVYMKGWKATIDGVPVPLHRAFKVFRAVEVPAGMSKVLLSYEPESFRVGAAVSGITFLFMILCLITKSNPLLVISTIFRKMLHKSFKK